MIFDPIPKVTGIPVSTDIRFRLKRLDFSMVYVGFTFRVPSRTVVRVVTPMTSVYGTVVPPHGPVTAFNPVTGRGKGTLVNAVLLVPLAFGL